MNLFYSVFFILLHCSSLSSTSTDVIIDIYNIRNNSGQLILAVFSNNDSFVHEKPIYSKPISKQGIKNHCLSVCLKMNTGIYGLSVLDDENENGKMEYNFMGLPREGFGFSNYYHSGIRKPNFENFCFRVDATSQIVKVKMKYF